LIAVLVKPLPACVVVGLPELVDMNDAVVCAGPDDEPEAVVDVEEVVVVRLDAVDNVEEGESVLVELNAALVEADETVETLNTDCDPPESLAFGHSAFTPRPWKKDPITVFGLACVP